MANVLLSAVSARRGGGQTYVRNIAQFFPAAAGHTLTILSADPIPGLSEFAGVEWERAPSWTRRPISRVLLGALYFRFLWPRRHDFDVVYYAGGSRDVPVPGSVRKVVAFRNMLPFDHEARRRYHWGWNRIRHAILEPVQAAAFKACDLVIFISDYASGVIDSKVPGRRGRSVVIPHGARPTQGALSAEISARLPAEYVLYLSILDPYKAQVELVEAWSQLRRARKTNEKLVLAGPDMTRYAKGVHAAIARLSLEDEVVVLGSVPHDQVSALARGAKLNVFLSSCENCPNILLELMCIGAPLLVSSYPPMPELGGDELEYVDPYTPDRVAKALARLLDDPRRRDVLSAAASQRAKFFTWERAGQATWRAILDCAGVDSRSNAAPTAPNGP